MYTPTVNFQVLHGIGHSCFASPSTTLLQFLQQDAQQQMRGCYPDYGTSTCSHLAINGKWYLTSSNRLFISPTSLWFSCSNCKRGKKKKKSLVRVHKLGLGELSSAFSPSKANFTFLYKDLQGRLPLASVNNMSLHIYHSSYLSLTS